MSVWDPDPKGRAVKSGTSVLHLPHHPQLSPPRKHEAQTGLCLLPSQNHAGASVGIIIVVEGDNYPANEAHFPFSSPP